MQNLASSVEEYLESLPDDRRNAIMQVREIILSHLPNGYIETMNWGMISYEVPLDVYPDTYNKKPFLYAALASQKSHMAVYLSGINGDEKLRAEFEANYKDTGKKMDIGKSCVRFKKLENLPLDLIGKAIGAIDMELFVKKAEACRK